MKTPTHKLQAIVSESSKWPYLGNGYSNQDGSVTLVLDPGVVLQLPDGQRFAATTETRVRLMLRASRGPQPAGTEP